MRTPTNGTHAVLEAAWNDLGRRLALPIERSLEIFNDLVTRYDSPNRAYHNTTHLVEMLAILSELCDDIGDTTAVLLAAWFHDAVYDSQAKDNEEQSALLASQTLGLLGLPESLIAEVRRLILLTRTHEAPGDDKPARALLDSDLAILGASPERYADYAAAIRQEYAWVTEEDYRAGRARVLLGFLNRDRIYLTEYLSQIRESSARKNLLWELDRLRTGEGERC